MRYERMLERIEEVKNLKRKPFIFIKIGGPFLRASFLRGEIQWYMDLAQDPEFAAELTHLVTDHLIAIGIEALRKSRLRNPSIWIYDDVASNHGLLISPKACKRTILPEVGRMVESFKAAGAIRVGYHSDGDIREILDLPIDAGISILNPVEPRANMDVAALCKRYKENLIYVGGLCNSMILPRGTDGEVRKHVQDLISVAKEGGVIIGSHSIGNDIPVERYEMIMKILHQNGRPCLVYRMENLCEKKCPCDKVWFGLREGPFRCLADSRGK